MASYDTLRERRRCTKMLTDEIQLVKLNSALYLCDLFKHFFCYMLLAGVMYYIYEKTVTYQLNIILNIITFYKYALDEYFFRS